ncbi:MAG: NmrA family NAD(P)-binding protein, partial [Propionibacteriaceae bacterium]|nr:NmrA family NAD(P)-binding protein [Propionibacteriaceae bacterium]
RLRQSGMTWTVLQPNFYMDIWIPAVVGGPALAGQPVTLVGDGRRVHSMVAVADVAHYAVAALDHHEAHNQTLYVGGPQPASWLDVVSAFEAELGRHLPVRTISPGEPIPGQPEFVGQLAAVLASYDSPMDISELSRRYGVAPTTLAEFVAGFLANSRSPVG